MEKVEQYIKAHTITCSNKSLRNDKYYEWLTPANARAVAEIARKETINEVCEWIKHNVYSYTWYDFQQHEGGIERGKLIGDLKKHFVNE